jgi:hypothetical protein
MVRMLTLSALDRGLELWSGQIKDYKIGICYFSAKNSIKEKEQRLVGSESG